VDDDTLQRKMAELTFEAAKEMARRLGPVRARVFWGYAEALARGEITTDEFGELLDRLRSSHSCLSPFVLSLVEGCLVCL
jgi:hypothetical protein